MPRGRRSCLLAAGVGVMAARRRRRRRCHPPQVFQVDLLAFRHHHQPWRGRPCRCFTQVKLVEMDEEPVNVEERFGPGVIQGRWEMCGCAERVAQWGAESHASLSIESRVVI